jgi:hypothetical protein
MSEVKYGKFCIGFFREQLKCANHCKLRHKNAVNIELMARGKVGPIALIRIAGG